MPSSSIALAQRADAEAAGVLGAEVLVDDDDGKAESHVFLAEARTSGGEA